ncbi:MAG: rRNA maturation RNase YbeY [Bacteroidales bacterium]|nr:rRNA maturation RNase YbeY [Bacteroidales bacterium]
MIRYFNEGVQFTLKDKLANNRWLKLVAGSEVRSIGDINIIFCSDNYILDVNLRYLGHDYFTDIITFDYCEGKKLSGDLFISVDSVRENAIEYGVEFEEEIHRVMVHGLLHLIGYDDHTPEDERLIHDKEDYYLKLRNIA